jgi:CPA2 family monovalent cation:H+ antiporter-2
MLILAAADTGNLSTIIAMALMLAAAAVVSIVLRHIGVSPIPAYLVTGVLIGPGAFGLVSQPESVEFLSNLALVLLMFGIGLQLEIADIKGNVAQLVIIGVLSWFLSSLIGTAVALAFRLDLRASLVVAMALSMSSTAVVLRILHQRRELRTPAGRTCLGVLILQDIIVVAVLAVIPLLATDPNTQTTTVTFARVIETAAAVGAIALMMLGGRILLPRLLALASKGGSPEGLMVAASAVAMSAAALTTAFGFSAELGAFVAGFLLATTPFRFEISGQLAPLRDLLMAFFLISVGMTVNFSVAASYWPVIIVGLALLLVVKSFVIGFSAWLAGASAPLSVVVGLTLAEAGEFSLVVLATGWRSDIISSDVQGVVITIVVLSLLGTPSLLWLAQHAHGLADRLPHAPWARRARSVSHAGDPLTETKRHVVIAGFGPVGRSVAERLGKEPVTLSIIDLNAATIRKQSSLGLHMVFGDASNVEVLRSAGADHADAVVLALPDDHATLRACTLVHSLNPTAVIIARTNFLSRSMAARELGARYVVAEEIATSHAMVSFVERWLAEAASDHADATPDQPS